MTRDDISKMAAEAFLKTVDAGVVLKEDPDESKTDVDHPSFLERFAELVAAHEREACAKLIESRKSGANELMDLVRDMEAQAIYMATLSVIWAVVQKDGSPKV